MKESEQDEEINILLLGPSGSGKTLFINSIFNYLQYSSIEESIESSTFESLGVIPNIVSMVDSELNEYQVELGKISEITQQERDNFKQGKSITTSISKYKIKLNDNSLKTLCLIDTQGIGDTQGLLQDEMNFNEILREVGKLKSLQAILIVMKPNENRMNATFKFCINELLCHLHVSAKNNIFYCLTNSRSIMYRANGCDTKRLLDIQLNKIKSSRSIDISSDNRVYCFDNESYNYIALKKSGGTFSEFEESLYTFSWSKSVQELTRLLQDVLSIEPHDIQNTISINLARRMINQLSQPISICILNINENLKAINCQKQEIQSSLQLELDELKLKLYTPFVNFKSLALDKRVTICTNTECMFNPSLEKCVSTVNGQIKKISICCDHCNQGDKFIYLCKSINLFGFCKNCKCHCSKHLNIDSIEEREEIQLILDDSIQQNINSKQQCLNVAQELISNLESRIATYKEELSILEQSSIDFSCFLFKNSLVEYNDEIESYIELLINNEKVNKSSTSSVTIENLQNYLNNHKAQISKFKSNIQQLKDQKLLKINQIIKENQDKRGIFYELSEQEKIDDQLLIDSINNQDDNNDQIKSAIEIKLKIDQILNLQLSGSFIKSKLILFENLDNQNSNNYNVEDENKSKSTTTTPQKNAVNNKRNNGMISRILSGLYYPSTSPPK